MTSRRLCLVLLPVFLCLTAVLSAGELAVHTDFEGGSAAEVKIDQAARTIAFTPGGDPARGWPCWWYLRISGASAGEPVTLRLTRSGRSQLAASWSMPSQASFSTDGGKTWRHTEKGARDGEAMVYQVTPAGESVLVAWGPPFTPRDATALVQELAEKVPGAVAEALCQTREGRPVPLLRLRAGEQPAEKRFGVWVHARQHAWESGSSWVARGFADFLLTDTDDARWLREHAELCLVPIMDIDNTATGNGGKDAKPQDHNRDWSDSPHWPEVAAAKRQVVEWVAAGRMDVFLDLHNPGPGDPTFFYALPPELMKGTAIPPRDRFIELVYSRISRHKPLLPMSNKPKVHGAEYHPLWKQISANWVNMHGGPETVSLCLETGWNNPRGTTDGYRAVGQHLAAGMTAYLRTLPPR